MRYALVQDIRAEATPAARGVCSNCGSPMIARCGRVKVWHWAHKGRHPCDPWWEAETDWHRSWKDRFPKDWQEVVHTDEITGEKHIADVKNSFGLVIEFQHSPLHPSELLARETFYRDMIWIVDGCRGELDAAFFRMGLGKAIQENPLAFPLQWWGRSRLLHNWSEAKSNVYLDFGGDDLWRLVFFNTTKKVGAVGPIHKSALIEDCMTGTNIRVSYRSQNDNASQLE